MKLDITKKQRDFIRAGAFEVLFGGAAGGGKTFGQLIDALLYGAKYPASRQLILRRTYPELEKTFIVGALALYPREIARYNDAKKRWTLKNGSVIEFGYCDGEKDVYRYQGAEYDVIRFDELTHFSKHQYTYLMSRCRGANGYPKHIKSSTNPGGVGHTWVKERFIDPAEPGEEHLIEGNTVVFIPSKIGDNVFLQQYDPAYIRRLRNLPDSERRALELGDWDIYEGVYFDEFRRDIHVVQPFPVPKHWRRYLAIDYGLDMLAAYVGAFSPDGWAYVIREYCESNLIVSRAAERIKDLIGGEEMQAMIAPPDLAARSRDTGKSVLELFLENGLSFTTADNNRVSGWMNLKEWLKPCQDEQGQRAARLRIFSTCRELIRTLPALQRDEKNVSDCATEPHDLTHSPDALRYLFAGRPTGCIHNETAAERAYYREIDEFLEFGG